MKKLKYKNGDMMDALGLGTWQSEPGEVTLAITEALKVGFRHIDCAAFYGNEAEIGEALAQCIRNGIVKRKELWITSKLWNNAHKESDVEPTLQKTLKDLQLDYLDLYLVHWPVVFKPDEVFPQEADGFLSLEEIPIAETWKGMESCVDQGLSKHIGVSNFSKKKIQELLSHARIRPEMNQVEMHPFLQQNDLVNFCKEEDIHITAYSPLGSLKRSDGLRKEDEPNLFINSTIIAIAQRHQCTPAQVLLSWHLIRGTSAIPKSVNPTRLRENMAAVNIALTEDDMDQIGGLDKHYRYFDGTFWVVEGNSYTLANLWDE